MNVGMEESAEHPGELPFAETIYMFSALLDTNFCLDHDVLAAEDVKKKVKEKLLGKHIIIRNNHFNNISVYCTVF